MVKLNRITTAKAIEETLRFFEDSFCESDDENDLINSRKEGLASVTRDRH